MANKYFYFINISVIQIFWHWEKSYFNTHKNKIFLCVKISFQQSKVKINSQFILSVLGNMKCISGVEQDISLVHFAHSWDILFNTRNKFHISAQPCIILHNNNVTWKYLARPKVKPNIEIRDLNIFHIVAQMNAVGVLLYRTNNPVILTIEFLVQPVQRLLSYIAKYWTGMWC